MTARGLAIIAALIAGAVALLVLKFIGLVIKFALIIALLITLAAWISFAAIAQKFREPR
ncbi:MAG TPA: hypothetical protein VGI89_04615 [Rhizomicrobium sp.]|jgi:hypothetical protein